jgi:Amt family ammonium transporter
MFGGVGGISLVSQLAGSITAVLFALVSGLLVYGVLLKTTGIRLHEEDEYNGADLAIHKIGAYPEDHIR